MGAPWKKEIPIRNHPFSEFQPLVFGGGKVICIHQGFFGALRKCLDSIFHPREYYPRTHMTHILEDLTHKIEGQPPKKGVGWVLSIYHSRYQNGQSTYPSRNSQSYDQGLWKPLVSFNAWPAIKPGKKKSGGVPSWLVPSRLAMIPSSLFYQLQPELVTPRWNPENHLKQSFMTVGSKC